MMRALALALALLPVGAVAQSADLDAGLNLILARCLVPILHGEAPDSAKLDLVEPPPDDPTVVAVARVSDEVELRFVEENDLHRCHLIVSGIGKGNWSALSDGFEKRLARGDIRELPSCASNLFTFYEGSTRTPRGKVPVADTLKVREGLIYVHTVSVREEDQPYSEQLPCHD